MFGYIKPQQDWLRVYELNRFKSIYCGLCNSIYLRYGLVYTAFLSYDISYYALVLTSLEEGECSFCKKRCSASPLRRKTMQTESPSLALAADISILLAYYKILDSIADEKGLKRFGARCTALMMRPAFKKARERQTVAEKIIKTQLETLAALEKASEASPDKVAHVFATLLSGLGTLTHGNHQVMEQLFYHIGRWIYLIDAIHDLEEDAKTGSYNPIALRYCVTDGKLTEDDKESLAVSLGNSIHFIQNAAKLLDEKRDSGILENIHDLALPETTASVLNHTFNQNGGMKKHE